MKAPSEIKVGCHKIKVIYKPSSEVKGYLGLCDADSNVIVMRKNLEHTKHREVLLHEVIHAIDENYGLKLGEEKVNNLAQHFYSLLSENKEFVKFLMEVKR